MYRNSIRLSTDTNYTQSIRCRLHKRELEHLNHFQPGSHKMPHLYNQWILHLDHNQLWYLWNHTIHWMLVISRTTFLVWVPRRERSKVPTSRNFEEHYDISNNLFLGLIFSLPKMWNANRSDNAKCHRSTKKRIFQSSKHSFNILFAR